MANTATDIQKLYVAYFNRPADKLGLEYWMKSSMTVQQIANSFAVQDEYKNAYAGKTTSEIVNQIYKNLFNREADVEGLSYWVGEISAGRSTLGYAAFQIMNGPKAGSVDAIAVENKVAAAAAYTTEIDTTVEVIAYESANAESLGTVKAWLAGVTDAATLATAKTTLAANLKAVVDAKANVVVIGKSFTLLNTADTVQGTDNNDTIVATDLTLSSADRIMGGAGADELKLSAQATTTYAAFEMKGVETVVITADNTSTQTIDLSGATDITLLKSLNSSGSVALNQVTTLANVEVNNTTTGGNVTVSYQDAVVAGKTDTVKVALANNSNAGIGTFTLGSTGAALGGVETIAITTSGAASTVATLASTAPTITVDGDKSLTVTNNLNDAVTTVDASKLTGTAALNIKFAATTAVTSVKTAGGADTVNMSGNLKNATVSLGAEADILTAGLGDDTIDLGEGNDRIDVAVNGLTVNDSITGGAGADTLRLLAADTISKSEAEKVTAVETFDLRGTGGTVLTVTDNLLTTISTGSDRFTVTTAASTGANTVDITNLTFGNTNKLQVTGGLGNTAAVAQNETVIANDATVNAKAILSFGSGTTDTLRVIDGATMTADDLSGITGLEVIDLRAASAVAQTWNIFLTDALVRGATLANSNADDSVGGVAVASDAAVTAGTLVIDINNNIPAGSIVNINTDGLTADLVTAGAVLVKNNANVTVNVTGTGATYVAQQNSNRYTLNSDNMPGTAGKDTFIADSLSQVQVADSITGGADTDTLQLNFSLNNVLKTVSEQLNGTAIATTEVLTFNTNNAIAFSDINIAGFNTVNFSSGDDTVGANNTAATFNMGNGANTFTAAGIVTETITTGTGIDTFNFTTARLLAADTITAGTARDVLNLTGSTAAVYALQTATLSGIDTVNYTTADVADGLTVNTAAVAQSELGLVIVATDATAGANTAAIFDASGVATGSNVTVTVNAAVAANLGLATNAADVIGGAGSDIITLGSAGAAAVGGAGGGYVVRGNAGADTIAIGANATGVIVNINSANDGGAQGATSGFDVITGFTTAVDGISFTDNVIESVFQTTAARGNLAANARAGNANVVGAAGGVGVLAAVTDAAVNFNNAQDALVITQIGGGTTDAQLTDLAFIASKINVLGVTASATDGGIVVVQGQTKSMIYLYVEQDGTANAVATSELKLLAQVDTNTLVAGDLFVM